MAERPTWLLILADRDVVHDACSRFNGPVDSCIQCTVYSQYAVGHGQGQVSLAGWECYPPGEGGEGGGGEGP